MCGIIGVASTEPIADRKWLAIGRDAMTHRGPDDSGEVWLSNGCVGLGHRRLAIIDLSRAGHQPMADESGELSIIFNGEIYDFRDLRRDLLARGHKFASQTDTEVILAAYREWDTECLTRLNGMFAFALFDSRKMRLFMARDRAGEKPLYYSQDGGTLRFSSELKGLLADPTVSRELDLGSLDCYLAMGFVPGGRSILRDINKLPPAHALTFDLKQAALRVWRYWKLPDLDASALTRGADEGQLLDELETLLESAVRRQLVADVPVGVLLSGGVDSSLVTAMAVRAAANVKSFTVRFPGHHRHDETEHAKLIANHFGTEHTELEAGESSVDLLPLLARHFDEPIADSSMVPTYLVSRLIRNHCTVALGGDGGDELFGGYTHYSSLLQLNRRVGRIPRRLRMPVARVAEAFLPVGLKGRNWLQGLEVNFQESLPLTAPFFDRSMRRRLMAGHAPWALVAEGIREDRIPASPDLLQRATRMDLENYLVEDILVKVDRASMANSLEVRAPMLDYRLIEFAFRKVPSALKATATTRKVLLKRLTERVLPPEFNRHRKQGFSIPLAGWLETAPWRNFFREVLLGNTDSLFDRQVVAGLLDSQDRGRSNSERLFALVMFELWRREYRVLN